MTINRDKTVMAFVTMMYGGALIGIGVSALAVITVESIFGAVLSGAMLIVWVLVAKFWSTIITEERAIRANH